MLVSLKTQLRLFAARSLRQLPMPLWWVLGLLVGAFFSVRLEKELFPHTPAAVQGARWLFWTCASLVPVLGVWWVWRVAASLQHAGWRLLWYLGAFGATGLLGVAAVLAIVVWPL